MHARLLSFIQRLADAFWLLPAALVIALGGLGPLVVDVQQSDNIPRWLAAEWVYGGGETGARAL